MCQFHRVVHKFGQNQNCIIFCQEIKLQGYLQSSAPRLSVPNTNKYSGPEVSFPNGFLIIFLSSLKPLGVFFFNHVFSDYLYALLNE